MRPVPLLQPIAAVSLALAGVSGSSVRLAAQAAAPSSPQRLEIGHLKARALLQCAESASRNAPVAIIVPGTGAHGPEEAMPASLTADGKETQILTSFAQGLRAAGFHTLQLGKPGIEFHTGWDTATFAYDRSLFQRLTWNDLLESTDEAIDYVERQRPCGGSSVVLVSHSEGTGRVLDVAARNTKVRGLVFLGFHGHSLKDMVDYQAYERPIEMIVKTDVDADHDGFITREEAARWPKDFTYAWKDGETRISISDYARFLRENPEMTAAISRLSQTPLYGNGIWDRAPMFAKVAALTIPVVAFNGTADVTTPPRELEGLRSACKDAEKVDCETYFFPGVGHYFSAPRPPRGHPVLDMTYGPVSPAFLDMFTRTLATWRVKVSTPERIAHFHRVGIAHAGSEPRTLMPPDGRSVV